MVIVVSISRDALMKNSTTWKIFLLVMSGNFAAAAAVAQVIEVPANSICFQSV
jgi:hypothetical protein